MPLNLKLYSSAEFDQAGDDNKATASNFMKFLLYGLQPTWRDFIPFKSHNWRQLANKTLYRCILKEKDPEVFKALRREFKSILEKIPNAIEGDLNDDEQRRIEFLVHNLLGLYPFVDPKHHEKIKIPRYVDNQWVLVTHKVERIKMSPTNGHSELKKHINTADKVYSYGFVPLNNKKLPPILSLMGTTYPTGQGKKVQDLANITPNADIGSYVFQRGKPQVEEWMRNHEKIILTGISQGGILTNMFAMNMPEKIDTAYSFNPPGFMKQPTKDHKDFGAWFKTSAKDRPTVHIISQDGDPVSAFGVFPEDMKFWKTKLPPAKYWRFPILWRYIQHIVANPANPDCEILEADIKEANSSRGRKVFSWIVFNILRPIVWAISRLKHWALTKIIKDELDNAFQPQTETNNQEGIRVEQRARAEATASADEFEPQSDHELGSDPEAGLSSQQI